MHVLHAGKCALEPQTVAHAEPMFAILIDARLYAYENAPPASLDWLRTRFTRLESRLSGDSREQWLNWVIRLESGELAGYVQATVRGDGSALLAYVLGSAHWARGIAQLTVRAMMVELRDAYRVRRFLAVLKGANTPSRRLLERLGFDVAPLQARYGEAVDDDELCMQRDEGVAV